MNTIVSGSTLAAALICLSTAASAHVTFETAQVPPNATAKAVLRVPHGCEAKATTAIRIRMPEGVADVKPMPKAGWTLTAETAEGGDVVREIAWSGGSLPDAFYDEFVFRVRVPAELDGRTLAFPVVQECGAVTERWEEVAQAGQDAHDLKFRPRPSWSRRGRERRRRGRPRRPRPA